MTRGSSSSMLSSHTPSAVAPAQVTIGHIQLRDVLICSHEKGIVTYPHDRSIVEHDLVAPNTTPRQIAKLTFIPNSLSSLIVPNTDDTILAAGGQEAELHLSYYSSACSSREDGRYRPPSRGFGRQQWEKNHIMEFGSSINNSVLLTSLSLSGSQESSTEPRVVVSNNDKTVKFFDIAVRSHSGSNNTPRIDEAGQLRLNVPVNHSSISPDGRTLLCVGDSPEVLLYRITGGARLSFAPIAMLSLSQYIDYSPYHSVWSGSASVPASFSSAFSSDGSKFAVASQEGAVVVWDVRSTKPLKVFETDKNRSASSVGNGGASGWLSDTPWDWANGRGRAPGWGVRSVKFSPAGVGREVMTFTEHTSQVHFVDARTFDHEEVVHVPNFDTCASSPLQPRPRSISPPPRSNVLAAAAASREPRPLPPPRIVLFSGALEDTFRIADVNPRWRLRPMGRGDLAEDDADSIVVIPPLGDREVEDDVRRLLGRHGLRTRRTNSLDREWEREDGAGWEHLEDAGGSAAGEMDVDELESDCFSSHTPSRAPSPVSTAPPTSRPPDLLRVPRPTLLARRESSGLYGTRRPSGASRRHRRSPQADIIPEVDQDLAGTCFDPSGTCVYVASTKGVAEWRVHGAEQRWWADTTWA